MNNTNYRRVLIIDGLNNFIRNYIVNPSMTTNGNPVGGVVGFIGMLNKLFREMKPTQAVIRWDGPGGSQRRRELIKEYKSGRKPIKKNFQVDGMDEQTEKQNKVWQHSLLLEILNEMPIMQFVLDSVEADDIVSYVAKHPYYAGWQKVIVSSDKDFLQLLDNETVLFRPIQKQIHTSKNVIEEFGISPKNFAVARAIAGDKSDSLPGVPGIGLPTIAKRLSFLKEDQEHYLEDVIRYCEQADQKQATYKNIVSNADLVRDNYKIMNLTPPSISPQGRSKIDYVFENFEFDLNITNLKTLSYKNGFPAFDWSDITSSLRRISTSNKKVVDEQE